MPTFYAGWKTVLKVSDGGNPETFTTVAAVTDISGPTINVNTADITNRDSNGYTDVIAVTKSLGELSFDIIYDPAEPTHERLRQLVDSGDKRNFKLVLADQQTAWQFAGYVTAFEVNSALDDAMRASITVSLTGAPMFTATP